MRHLIYLTILLLSSTPSFSDDGSSGITAGETAQIAGLLGGLAGGKVAGQAGNAAALISGISKLNTDLKKAELSDPAAATDITTSANSMNAELRGQMEPAFAKLSAELSSAALASATEVTALQAAFNAYMVSKEACVKSAETSVMLCSEGTSPGAIKVKALMELATPALGLISSAQKACSSTAQVTDFLSKGLIAAKGVCVAAKAMCDTTCGTANSQLAALKTKIHAFANTKAGPEITKKMAEAGITPEYLVILENANQSLISFLATTQVALPAEQVPGKVGSTGYLVARCQSNFKDIAMFGVNIASLVVAKKSADDCAAKLAGTAGAKISTLQFCENPANATSDFCKCQKDNTQKGCPGYIAKSEVSKDPSVDVKNVGKGNQFASGAVNSGPSSVANSAGGLSSENAAAPNQAALDSATGSLYGSTSGGSGSNSFGSASSATDASGSDKNPEKKKWSFGAFMSSFGGGSGSGGGSSSAKTGSALGQKNMEAIKRQIASEQLRAEVSESSGKSNWEKVRERYNSNTATLLSGK